MPHESVPPQPLEMVPQFLPCAAQVVGVQPQTFKGPPPPHEFGRVQEPHCSVPPQPSSTAPQFLPSDAQVALVQPHTLGAPPPAQVFGAAQVPQL